MKLKKLIEENKLNQTELAKTIKVSQKTISNYLSGETEPTMSVLIKLADYFGVSLDYLCERQFNNNIGYIPDNKKEGVKKLLNLTDFEYEKVIAYITALNDVKK